MGFATEKTTPTSQWLKTTDLSRKSNTGGLTFQGKCPPYSSLVIHPFKAAPWLPRGEEGLSMEVKCFGFTTTFAAPHHSLWARTSHNMLSDCKVLVCRLEKNPQTGGRMKGE